MTREELEDVIIQTVGDMNGGKPIEIITRINPQDVSDWKECIVDIMYDLVKQKRLIEIEYVLSNSSYQLRSFFLPADALVVRIHGQGDT